MHYPVLESYRMSTTIQHLISYKVIVSRSSIRHLKYHRVIRQTLMTLYGRDMFVSLFMTAINRLYDSMHILSVL